MNSVDKKHCNFDYVYIYYYYLFICFSSIFRLYFFLDSFAYVFMAMTRGENLSVSIMDDYFCTCFFNFKPPYFFWLSPGFRHLSSISSIFIEQILIILAMILL